MIGEAFCSNGARRLTGGARYDIAPERCHQDWSALFWGERERENEIEFVTITSPNYIYFPAAKGALEAGIPVLSDKPDTTTLQEAAALSKIVRATGLPYGLTYTYPGYPMVRGARCLVEEAPLLSDAIRRRGNEDGELNR